MPDPMANPGGFGVPPPFRWLPWLAGPLAAAALLATVDGGLPPPVDAGAVGGSIELGGSGNGTASSSGAGSLDLGGSGAAEASSAGSGSLSLGGSGLAEAVAAPAGSLSLGGSGTWTEPAAGSLVLGGTAASVAASSGSGSLQLGGTATWTATAAGSINLGGSGAASAEPVATGSLDLGGTSAGSAQPVGAGSIVLGGTGAWTTVAGGSLDLGGAGSGAAEPVAAGSLTLGGSGSPTGGSAGAGSLTLGGAGAARAAGVGSGSLTLGGTGTGTSSASASGTGSLTLGGAAVAVKLGVLKVNVGTAPSPDWRNVGCGGGPPGIADTFDRANTTTTLGTASDGGTWTQFGTAAHINGNQAALSTSDSASREVPGTSTDVTLTIDNYRPTTAGSSQLFFFADTANPLDTSHSCYRFEFDSGSSFGSLQRRNAGTPTTLSSTFINSTAWTGGTATLEFKRVGNLITVKINGALRFSATDSSPLPATNRWCGFRGQQTDERWDNFTATDAAATTGRLKLWDGTQWVQEKCDNAALFSDNFNRADSTTTLGSPWTVVSEGGGGAGVGKFGISSNRAYCSASYTDGFGTTHGTLAYVDYGISDFDMSVKWSVTDPDYGVMFRLSGTSSFFWIGANRLWYYNIGATILNNFSSAFVANDVMRVLAVGSTINIYKNGTLLRQQIDTRNVTATRHGFMGNAGAPAYLDDFSLSPIARPLYAWTGTAWDQVACMVPA